MTYPQIARAPIALLLLLLALSSPLLAAGDVPIQGSGRGSVTGVEPVAEGVAMTTTSTGRASHLGSYRRTEELVLDPASGQFTGEVIFTAANGDTLHAEVSGIFVSPTTATGTYTFDGGTGRFEGADGEAAFVVYSSDGVHFKVLFRGAVSR
jgi:hypothetical protein